MKKYLIFFLLIFFILLSSVSASDVNSTDLVMDSTSQEDEELINVNEDIEFTLDEVEDNDLDETNIQLLTSNSKNSSLTSSSDDLIVNPDFEDGSGGWNFVGSASVSGDVVYSGSSSAFLSALNDRIYQSVDWTNIESINFHYYVSGLAGLRVYIHDDYSFSQQNEGVIYEFSPNPTSTTGSWVDSGEIDTSDITGESYLIFYIPMLFSGDGVYVDSITFTVKESSDTNLIVNPDFEDGSGGWNFVGSASVSGDVVYSGSSSAFLSALNDRIYQSVDWTNIESINFHYYVSGLAGLRVYIHDDYSFSQQNEGVIYEFSPNPTSTTGSWVDSGEIDTSDITGESYLIFYIPMLFSGDGVYVDSITYTVKNTKETFNINTYVDTPVYFNYSATNVNSWYWNFGDGKHSIDSEPEHTYNKTGTYYANLTITDGDDSNVIYYTVKVIDYPVADLNYIVLDNIYTFFDNSSGSIANYTLDYGDGSRVTFETWPSNGAQHNYLTFGSFNVTLTVTDILGTNSTTTKENLVNIYKSNSYLIDVDSFENGEDGWTLFDGAVISNYRSHDGDYSVFLNNSIEKIINLDNIDSIDFYLFSQIDSGGVRYFDLYIDGDKVYRGQVPARSWSHYSYSTKDLVGNHTVKFDNPSKECYIDDISLKSTSTYLANFSAAITDIDGDDITVKFTDNSYGTYNGLLWTFDGTNTSAVQNPTYTFEKGNHEVTLIIYRDNIKMSTITKVLSLNLPAVNGNTYSSIQDAIDNATAGDVIEIPQLIGTAYNENLLINKSLTLNFNGAVLTPADASTPLFNVTDGATVTVTNIGLTQDSTLITDSVSKLIVKDSIVGVDLDLAEGNIELSDNVFNDAYLTLVANSTIANSTVVSGGVIVNGGKSTIFNTTLTGCDVAITQTGGELDVISNLIAENNIGVNVTGGETLLEYNLIYSNSQFGLVYSENVTNVNNWWGGNDYPNAFNDETLPEDYYDIFRYGTESADIESFLVLTLSSDDTVMGYAKEYTVNAVFISSDDGEIDGYLKTITLDFTSTSADVDSLILENGTGQTTLLTTVTEADSIILTALGVDYELDSVIVSVTNMTISLEGDEVVGGSVIVIVSVPYATGNVTIIVNSEEHSVELVDGIANYTITDLVAGSYSIVAVYDGNDIFANLYNSTSFTVESEPVILINTTVSADNLNIKAGNNGTLNVVLTDVNNNTLANKSVSIIIDGVTYTDVTNGSGVASFSIGFNNAGSYVGILYFAGDDAYDSALGYATVSVTKESTVVTKKATTITAPKKTFKAKKKTKKVKITLKSGSTLLSGKKITLKVKGKTYKAKTNSKGKATFKVKKLTKKGTYKYKVKFAGDSLYKAVSKKGKIKVKK